MICPYCGSISLRRVNALTRKCLSCSKVFDAHNAMIAERPRPPTPPPARSKYWIFNHQGKADRLVEALRDTQYEQSDIPNNYRSVKFVFTDMAAWGRVRRLQQMKSQGVEAFFIYPHSARPNLISDATPEWDGVTAQFVTAPGHTEILKSYRYPKPLHVVGWMLCPLQEFKPREQARNILFAPIHPRCDITDQRVNRKTFSILEKLARQDKIKLTVRYIAYLEGSGLKEVKHPNISYVRGQMDNSYDQLDRADVVVGSNTIAYISVARGVPTVMMAEKSLPEHWLKHPTLFAPNWNKYVDKLAYPLDILETSDPMKLMENAARSDHDILSWKKRMIGEPFCKQTFIETLDRYL